MTLYSDDQKQITEILNGSKNVLIKLNEFFLESKIINACGNDKSVLLATELEDYKKLLKILKEKDIKLDFVNYFFIR